MTRKPKPAANIRWLLFTCLLLIAVAGWTLGHESRRPAKASAKTPVPTAAADTAYDPKLLQEFSERLRSLDLNREHCLVEARLDMIDGQDTSRTARGLSYIFCRNGKDFYCRVGEAETIHTGTRNLFIRRDLRRVVLSSRDIPLRQPLAAPEALLRYIRNESYRLRAYTAGSKRTLSLLNEHHLACKEISLTYDTASRKLQSVMTRLTDLQNPTNPRRDRVTILRILRSAGSGRPEHYRAVSDVVQKENGKWKLTGEFAGYKLIML
jgi:hypothetical protein